MLADQVSGGQVHLLQEAATDDLLMRACAHNHLIWAQRHAVASGGEVLSDSDLGGIRAARLEGAQSHLVASLLEEPEPGTRAAVAELVGEAARTGVQMLSVWAVRETDRRYLDPWLGARGGRRGGQPHWMVRDCAEASVPPSAEAVAAVTDFTIPEVFHDHVEPELHCYHPDQSATWQRMTEVRPQRVWHAVQWREGLPVGQISINLTEGDLGVVGLHDAVFLPSARVRGPGLSRADFFFRFALDLGARYIVLNAADNSAPLWRAIGFRDVGHGQTWWFPNRVLRDQPPEADIRFAEAIGLGDIDGIDPPPERINARLANGLTPLQFAALTGQPAAADELLRLGATPDLLALWDLGRRDEAVELLRTSPGIVNERAPRSGKSLLHRAVERDDPDLVTFLLATGADPDARDSTFDATPLGWARELRKTRVAAALRRWSDRG